MTSLDVNYMTDESDTALSERQALIVQRVADQGFVTIDALAQDFEVSAQTVRREIIRLDELGLLRRFHGGAGMRGSGNRLSYAAKQGREADFKRRIGVAMAAAVRPGQAVFLDVGTTAEATAEALTGLARLTVVTPGAANARILSANPGIEVVLTGGRIVGPDLSMVGPIALKTIGTYRFDWAIIACSGVDAAGVVLDFDADKIALKHKAMALAASKALIADSTKFSRSALMQVADLAEFDLVVTDAPPPPSAGKHIQKATLCLA
jgi:DeoR family transcriptional regulator, glycerol-3-phosphate regulon repressor